MSAGWFNLGDVLVDTRNGVEFQVKWITPPGSAGRSEADGPVYHARIMRDGVAVPGGFTADIWSGSRMYPTSAFKRRTPGDTR